MQGQKSGSIIVEGLTKSYQVTDGGSNLFFNIVGKIFGSDRRLNKTAALDNVSFKVGTGEAFGILGNNGSGKSTLLQILAGTLSPSGGSFKVNGKTAALLELGSGFNPEFSGRENIFINAALYGMDAQQVKEKFDAIVAFSEVGKAIEQPVRTYSSGMQMRLAFAVIAHLDMDILLIDEAFAVGDFFFMQKCLRFLQEFCQKGTLILVTHDLASLQSLCTNGILLDRGRIVSSGPVKQVCEHYISGLRSDMTYSVEDGEFNEKERPEFSFEPIIRRVVKVEKGEWREEAFPDSKGRILEFKTLNCSGQITTDQNVELAAILDFDDHIGCPLFGFHLVNDKGVLMLCEIIQLKEYITNSCKGAFEIRLNFELPALKGGLYSLHCGIAEGTISKHRFHHMVHDIELWEISPDSLDFAQVRVSVGVSATEATTSRRQKPLSARTKLVP